MARCSIGFLSTSTIEATGRATMPGSGVNVRRPTFCPKPRLRVNKRPRVWKPIDTATAPGVQRGTAEKIEAFAHLTRDSTMPTPMPASADPPGRSGREGYQSDRAANRREASREHQGPRIPARAGMRPDGRGRRRQDARTVLPLRSLRPALRSHLEHRPRPIPQSLRAEHRPAQFEARLSAPSAVTNAKASQRAP
jgi:hypothetical protein